MNLVAFFAFLVFLFPPFSFLFPVIPALSGTPRDTLIQAWALDDVLSLDPADIFEVSASEIAGNSYERLLGYDLDDVSKIFGVVAKSWRVSRDGRTIFFKIRKGKRFASGRPLTVADVVFSLHRVIFLEKTPSFIISQFGINKDNVKQAIRQTGNDEFAFTMDRPHALSLVLSCLTATVSSVVDRKLVLSHESDGDYGNGWLRTHYAGSGPFLIRDWSPNEAIFLERNEFYGGQKPWLSRMIYRHIPEQGIRRLLLEKGDVDFARFLGADMLSILEKREDISLLSVPKGMLYYLAFNQKSKPLSHSAVREALKYLVDYQALVDVFSGGRGQVRQFFLPGGLLGSRDETPYHSDVERARSLLAKAGYPDGFSLSMDVRNIMPFTGIAEALQQSFAKGGIRLTLNQIDHRHLLTRYRRREHAIVLAYWGLHYQDPHSNAHAFAFNPDNSKDTRFKTLAWRNSWVAADLTALVKEAALESDIAERSLLYRELQEEVRRRGPYIFLYQEDETVAMRLNIKGLRLGPSFDSNSFRTIVKE